MSNKVPSSPSRIVPPQQEIAWDKVKEAALKNDQLDADIKVGDHSITIERGLLDEIIEEVKVVVGIEHQPPSREETLKNLKDALNADFNAGILNLISDTGIDADDKKFDQFIAAANHDLQTIIRKLDTALSTSQAIQQAHGAAQSSLLSLRQRFAEPQQAPQIIAMKDSGGKETGEYCVINPAANAENLVLAGGGVKGAGYVGAYQAMEKSGVLKNLQRLAGSSAGAMSASLIAGGLNADEFQRASNDTNFWNVLVKSSNNMGALTTELAGGLGFSGGYAENKVNKEISASIKNFLNQDQLDLSILDENEQKIIAQLKEALNAKSTSEQNLFSFSATEKTEPITFGQLAILRKIDPQKFKELTVTGFNQEIQKEEYYNALNSPDMPIAEAVRISMALPLVFKPVVLGGYLVVDGGVGSNEPEEVFEHQRGAHEKTLVLGFDNQGSFNHVVYEGKTDISKNWSEYFHSLLIGNKHLAASQRHDNQKLYNAGPDALDVYHGNLGTTSFLASGKDIHHAQRQAEVRMLEQLALRQHQATSEVFNDLEAVMESMTEEQLKLVADNTETSNSLYKEAAQEELSRRETWKDSN